jgi:hypothetical protein
MYPADMGKMERKVCFKEEEVAVRVLHILFRKSVQEANDVRTAHSSDKSIE